MGNAGQQPTHRFDLPEFGGTLNELRLKLNALIDLYGKDATLGFDAGHNNVILFVEAPIPAKLNWRIVAGDNHWGRAETLKEAYAAYRKVRGKHVDPNTLIVFAVAPYTIMNEMGGFTYKRSDPPPLELGRLSRFARKEYR